METREIRATKGILAKESSLADLAKDSTVAKEASLATMAQEPSVQTVLERIGVPTSPSIAEDLDVIDAKTKNLPSDPASKSDLEETHGIGSWEKAVIFKEE